MYTKKEIVENNIKFIKECEAQRRPLTEVARNLKMKYETLKKYLTLLGIDYKLNPNRIGIKHYEGRKPLESVLNGNHSNSAKRKRLIEEGVKESKCECCGLSEWMGKPIPLELHHKDFNHYNNSLDNLQILCANCHMQAHNYCNRTKLYSDNTKRCSNECKCEKETEEKKLVAKEEIKRKINVKKDALISDFENIKSFSGVGRKYGVSDNAIKKYCKRNGFLEEVMKYITPRKKHRML